MYHKLKMILLKIYTESKKKHAQGHNAPEISYNQIGLNYQDMIILDARNLGFICLNSANGFCLKEKYIQMNMSEFLQEIKDK